MPTELVWASISWSFRFSNYLWKTPIGWDSARRRFILVPGGIRIFFWWYFLVIYHPKPHIPLFFTLQYVMVSFASVLAADISFYIAMHGEKSVLDLNRVVQLYESMMAINCPRQLETPVELFGVPIPSLFDNGKLDKPGLALFLTLPPVPFASILLAPAFVLVAKSDVFQFVLEDILPMSILTNPVANIVLILLRIGLVYILLAENCRIFPFLIFLLGIPVQLVTRMVETLSQRKLGSNEKEWTKTLNYLTSLHILIADNEPEVARNTFLLMGIGLALSSCLNFAAIRFTEADMGFLVYLLFPFLSIIVMGVIIALLPAAIVIHENTKETLKKWGRGLGKKDGQLRRRIRATRPLKFNAGVHSHHFYNMHKEIMSTYIMLIVDYTVNLLVSMPNVNVFAR